MPNGYLCLILHAHLPFVRHPEHEHFLEENWLFEAISETYIPLLNSFERLALEGTAFRLTLSLSPTLLTMLADELLCQRYIAHLQRLIELSGKEIQRTRKQRQIQKLARLYHRCYKQTLDDFQNRYHGQLVPAFARLQQQGLLEIITCSATHGFLQLLQQDPGAVHAQLQTASDYYQRTFDRPAPGIWLPECSYYPGLEEQLKRYGFKYFIVDTHAIHNASVKPVYGHLAPITCANGIVAFGRDPDASEQVWSSEQGYPGDSNYREFHRDIGYELDIDYLSPYLPNPPHRSQTSLKYYRISDRHSDDKDLYQPRKAWLKAQQHAEHFLQTRISQVCKLDGLMDRPPIIVAPFDAELFGHWWFEGPHWLEHLIRTSVRTQDTLELITPTDYLHRHPMLQQSTPSTSSWGDQGYSKHWLNETTDWIFPHLHDAALQMQALARQYQNEPSQTLIHRAVTQAGRSLLLAQASDWPFILKNGTSTQYAARRVRDHLARFNYLVQSLTDDPLEQSRLDEDKLQAIETLEAIFPDLDFRIFAE